MASHWILILWTAFLLLACAAADGSAWRGSTELHTTSEVVATIVALMVGVVALIRYNAKKDHTFLFIGGGFLGTGLLDGYHALVTSSYFAHAFPSPPPSLIPWSWNASRMFLGLLLCLSVWSWQRSAAKRSSHRVSESKVYLGVVTLTLLSFGFFAVVPLPTAYYQGLHFGRPGEFVAGSLFLAALWGYLKKGQWRADAFERLLVSSLITGAVLQVVFMSRSLALFDAMFDAAHLLKVASYGLVFAGLLTNTRAVFVRAESDATALRQEIAERRHVEEVLRQSQERFSLAVLGSSDGIWDWLDVKKDEEWWSPRFYEILGYEEGEIEPKLSTFQELLHPDDRERTVAAVEDHLSGVAPFDVEYRLRTKTGDYRWIRARGKAFPSIGTRPTRMAGTISDIHDRKVAEQQLQQELTARRAADESLRASDARFERAVRGTSDGLWDWDIATNEVWFAPRFKELLGYSDEEFPHHFSSWESRVHPDDWAPTLKAVQTHLEKNDPYDVEYRVLTGSEEYKWFRARGVAERDDCGNPRRMSGSIQDITERKQTEERIQEYVRDLEEERQLTERQALELARANAELQQFAYAASHDLQEPLRNLVSYSTLLREDLGREMPAEASADLDYITSSAKRMQQLVQDLLVLSRAGTASMKCERVDLEDCVSDSLEALRGRLMETGAQVDWGKLPVVEGDSTLLRQLYQNLLGNAMKFSEGPPEIELTAEKQGNEWVLGVRDHGIGMDPKYTEQIFVPFKRLHGVSEYEGTGVGLAICKKTVERHGGRIWVESQPGEGSHFKFTLLASKGDTS